MRALKFSHVFQNEGRKRRQKDVSVANIPARSLNVLQYYCNGFIYRDWSHLAALEDPEGAHDHGDKGEVEDKQRDNKGKQVNGQVADNEEENKCVDMLCWDDCAQPLDSGS